MRYRKILLGRAVCARASLWQPWLATWQSLHDLVCTVFRSVCKSLTAPGSGVGKVWCSGLSSWPIQFSSQAERAGSIDSEVRRFSWRGRSERYIMSHADCGLALCSGASRVARLSSM